MKVDANTNVKRILRQKGQVAVPNKARYQYLQSYKFTPDVVVDVGGHSGTPQLYRAFDDTKFVLIDPRSEAQADTCPNHPPRDYDFHAVAAGAEPGQLTLNIPVMKQRRNAAMAGFRKVTGPMGRNIVEYETQSVAVLPLDQIMSNHPGRVGLKIDTEGFELEVLQGAVETLRRTDFVIIELSMTKHFDGIAPPSQTIAALAEAGLELRDILRVTCDGQGGPQPRLFDVLFTRWDTL